MKDLIPTPLENGFEQFVRFEINPLREVLTVGIGETGLTISDPKCADVWTLYGVLPSGQVSALHDVSDEDELVALLVREMGISPKPIAYHDEARTLAAVPTIAALVDALTGIILDDIEQPECGGGRTRHDAFDEHELAPLREAMIDL